ncbi:RDD family protein, partial [Verrucomicrobiales bacterium BCK34]|nr:RDD family protein [Verrucomicrobiales bacterium BCK34]
LTYKAKSDVVSRDDSLSPIRVSARNEPEIVHEYTVRQNMNSPSEQFISFWRRVWATIIDTILLCVLTFPPLIAIYGWSYFDPDETGFIAGPADIFFSWILPAVIIIGFWVWKQATPGKMAIRSKIVDAATGAKPTTKQWILRYIGYFISAIPLCLGMLWVAFDRRKQGWHDKMAGTVVVKNQ